MSLVLLPCQLRTSLDTLPPRHREAVHRSTCVRWVQCNVSKSAGNSPVEFCIVAATLQKPPVHWNQSFSTAVCCAAPVPEALLQNTSAANPETPAPLTALEASPAILDAVAVALKHLTDSMQGPHSTGRTETPSWGDQAGCRSHAWQCGDSVALAWTEFFHHWKNSCSRQHCRQQHGRNRTASFQNGTNNG